MSTAPAETARVTETYEVTVEPAAKVKVKKPKRRARWAAWWRKQWSKAKRLAKRAAAAIRKGASKTVETVKTAGSTAVTWMRRGASAAGRGAKAVGRRLYWSGATVGRGLGRMARFLGRSARTSARGTGRFLARTTGWTLRSISWMFRTVLDSLFQISFAAFVVSAVVMMFLAFSHDKYEEKVHRHAVAASRGHSVPKKEKTTTRTQAGWIANDMANRMGEWEQPHGKHAAAHAVETAKVTRTTEVEPGDIVASDDESIHAMAEEQEEPTEQWTYTSLPWEARENLWFSRTPDLMGVPDDASDSTLGTLLDYLYNMDQPSDILSMMDPVHMPLVEARQDLKDNELFQGKSYWKGRQEARGSLRIPMLQADCTQGWDEVKRSLREASKAAWALLDRHVQPEYQARRYHRSSLKQGFEHQTEFELKRFYPKWMRAHENLKTPVGV